MCVYALGDRLILIDLRAAWWTPCGGCGLIPCRGQLPVPAKCTPGAGRIALCDGELLVDFCHTSRLRLLRWYHNAGHHNYPAFSRSTTKFLRMVIYFSSHVWCACVQVSMVYMCVCFLLIEAVVCRSGVSVIVLYFLFLELCSLTPTLLPSSGCGNLQQQLSEPEIRDRSVKKDR